MYINMYYDIVILDVYMYQQSLETIYLSIHPIHASTVFFLMIDDYINISYPYSFPPVFRG